MFIFSILKDKVKFIYFYEGDISVAFWNVPVLSPR